MPDSFEFSRAHPDCTHCGTVERALTIWGAEVDKSCPCACHQIRLEHNRKVEALWRKRKGLR